MKFTTRVKPVKIRIISGGEEHSSLDTLKNNFSLTDIVELVKDNRLSTWLRRINAYDMANKVENIKLDMDGDNYSENIIGVKLSSIIFENDFSTIADLKAYWRHNNFTKNLLQQESDEAKRFIDENLKRLNENELYDKIKAIIDCLNRIDDSQKESYKHQVLNCVDENLKHILYKELQSKTDEEKKHISSFFAELANRDFELRYYKKEYSNLIVSFKKKFSDSNYLTALLKCMIIINDEYEEELLQRRIEYLDENDKSRCIEVLKNIEEKELIALAQRIRIGSNKFHDVSSLLEKDGANIKDAIKQIIEIIKSNWLAKPEVLESMIGTLSFYYQKTNGSYNRGRDVYMTLICLLSIHYQIINGKNPNVGVLMDIKAKDNQRWREELIRKISMSQENIKMLLTSICLYDTALVFNNPDMRIIQNAPRKFELLLYKLHALDFNKGCISFYTSNNKVEDSELDKILLFVINNITSLI